jgi:hypothetical protein
MFFVFYPIHSVLEIWPFLALLPMSSLSLLLVHWEHNFSHSLCPWQNILYAASTPAGSIMPQFWSSLPPTPYTYHFFFLWLTPLHQKWG